MRKDFTQNKRADQSKNIGMQWMDNPIGNFLDFYVFLYIMTSWCGQSWNLTIRMNFGDHATQHQPPCHAAKLHVWAASYLPRYQQLSFSVLAAKLHRFTMVLLNHLFSQILLVYLFRLDQIRSVTQSWPTLCDHKNCSTPGLPVHHQPPEFTETHVHRVSDAIQPSLPLSSPSPPAPNPSQHQSLFQWVNSSHEVAKVLEFQL